MEIIAVAQTSSARKNRRVVIGFRKGQSQIAADDRFGLARQRDVGATQNKFERGYRELPQIHFSQIGLAFSKNSGPANVYGGRLELGSVLLDLQIDIDSTDRSYRGQGSRPRLTDDHVPVKLRARSEVHLHVELSLRAE